MRLRWPGIAARALPLALLAGALCPPAPAAALSLDPFEYYDIDYRLVVSHTEVEPGEAFTVTVSADITCIKDMPFGVNEAAGVVSVLARHTGSDDELVLLDEYEVIIDGFPDWEGDEYALDETIDLSFPSDAPDGAYELVAKLERVSLDGWNVTPLIPGSYRSFSVASITCASEEAPPPPPPTPEPGTLRVAILGHDFRLSLDADAILLDELEASLVEGEVSLAAAAGTRCEDGSGEPLDYVSVAEDMNPPAYREGAIVAAYAFLPSGAQFYPAIEAGIAWDASDLPDGVEASDLFIAWYDRQRDAWTPLHTTVDAQHRIAYADLVHFTSVALLAPTAAPGPAQFEVRDLTVSPSQTAPLGKVLVGVTVRNTGGSAGTYRLEASIADERVHTQDMALNPGESRTVRFVLARSQPGVYRVEVAGLAGEFTVLAPEAVPGGATVDDTPPASPPSGTTPAPDSSGQEGLHPVYIALLALAGVAFMTLVVLVLAGVL